MSNDNMSGLRPTWELGQRLLTEFGVKARCRYTQRKARSLFGKLGVLLTHDEVTQLTTAWNHALSDEGPAELDVVIEQMKRARQ